MRKTLFAALLTLAAVPAAAQDAKLIERGGYLATIMDCSGCHTPGIFLGKPDFARALGGSEVGFQIPGLGVFYPPNLTSDAETGLGKWSSEDIAKVLRTGIRPDGRQLAPAMPYMSYGKLSDEDMKALVSYIKALPAVKNKVPGPFGPSEKPTAPYLTVAMP